MGGEVRFCVGPAEGEHSSIWKLWVHGDDVYFLSRGMGSDIKVSLHELGQSQFSETVPSPGEPNASRHLAKWMRPPVADPLGPTGVSFAFAVNFPRGEMRATSEDHSKPVTRLPLPSPGMTLGVQVFFAEPSASLPSYLTPFAALPLRCGKNVLLGYRMANLGTPEQVAALEAARPTLVIELPADLPPDASVKSEGFAWASIHAPGTDYHAIVEFAPTVIHRKKLN